MVRDFSCPICDGRCWRTVARHRYARGEGPVRGGALLREVLFDVWLPASSTIDLRVVFCEGCGFVCYSPRPTEAEIEAKYRHISAACARRPEPLRSARVRALRRHRAYATFRSVSAQTSRPPRHVLDVGGEDGHLMRPFLRMGAACHLVDYAPSAIAGVERLGSTIDDVPDRARYDVILCSHVLEHVADPCALLRRLLSMLSESGVLFVEVPLEVWRGAPIARDPVTHVNFFVPDTLRYALVAAGAAVCSLSRGIGAYETRFKRVARATAIRNGAVALRADRFSSDCAAAQIWPGPLGAARHVIESAWLVGVLNVSETVADALRVLRGD